MPSDSQKQRLNGDDTEQPDSSTCDPDINNFSISETDLDPAIE